MYFTQISCSLKSCPSKTLQFRVSSDRFPLFPTRLRVIKAERVTRFQSAKWCSVRRFKPEVSLCSSCQQTGSRSAPITPDIVSRFPLLSTPPPTCPAFLSYSPSILQPTHMLGIPQGNISAKTNAP